MRPLLLALALVLLAGACGDDDDDVATVDDDTQEDVADDTEENVADDTEEDVADDGAAEALTFFRATEAICIEHADRVSNPRPEPDRFVGAEIIESRGEDLWLLVDGLGDELIVDLERAVVFSVDGEDEVLPRSYSFGCPPELYLGTLEN